MLQLNHVTLSGNGKKILDDCTFQFKEGIPYVIVGEPDDFVIFFKAVCEEKKTDSGEIVTWDGAERFNACDDKFLPGDLTPMQYADGLLKLYKGEGFEPGVYLLEAGFDTSKKDRFIKDLDGKNNAALRFFAMKTIDIYVNVFGEPLPETGLLEDWVDKNKDDKVMIFGVSDEESAKLLKEKLGAEVIMYPELVKGYAPGTLSLSKSTHQVP